MLDSTLNDETEQDFTDFEPRSQKRAMRDCCHCQCHQKQTVKNESNGGKLKTSPKKIAKVVKNHDTEKHELGNCSTEDTLDSGFVTSDLVGASNGHVKTDADVETVGNSTKKIQYISNNEQEGTPEADNYNEDGVSGEIIYNGSHVNGETPTKYGDRVLSGITGGEEIVECSNFNGVHDMKEGSSCDEFCAKCEDDEDLNASLPESTGSLIAPEDNQFILNEALVLDCDSKPKGAKSNIALDDDNKSSIENSPKRCIRRIEFNLKNANDDEMNSTTTGTRTLDKSELNGVSDEKPSFRPVSLVIQQCDSVELADCGCNCHDTNRLQLPKTSAMRHHRDARHAPKESTGKSDLNLDVACLVLTTVLRVISCLHPNLMKVLKLWIVDWISHLAIGPWIHMAIHTWLSWLL